MSRRESYQTSLISIGGTAWAVLRFRRKIFGKWATALAKTPWPAFHGFLECATEGASKEFDRLEKLRVVNE